MAKTHVTLNLNGESTELLCEPRQTLLEVLRDELDLTGTKGRLRDRRLRRVQRAARRTRRVRVPQLVWPSRRRAARSRPSRVSPTVRSCTLQKAFLEHAALQCGICTPGFLVAAKALLERNPTERARGFATNSPATCAAAPATTRSCAPYSPRKRCGAAPRRAARHADGDEARGLRRAPAQVQDRRHAPDPPRRHRQGHRTRPLRRRREPARDAARQGAAQPARARAHPRHRHHSRGGAARREGDRHRRRHAARQRARPSRPARERPTRATCPTTSSPRGRLSTPDTRSPPSPRPARTSPRRR